MQLGLVTPILVRFPGRHGAWEIDAGVDELTSIARAADQLGYRTMTCSEHVGIPVEAEPVRGATYWDALSSFGYLSAVTERVELMTSVLVLGYHHPLEIVKRYGTLDRISGGRLVLGVGVGSLEPEFDLIDAPFDDRGARGDDSIRALRASFGVAEPEYHGTHYDYSGFVIDPVSVQAPPPIWVGGRTLRSLRRAITHGDGWAPFALSIDEFAALLGRARDTGLWEQRTEPFELAFQSNVLDPSAAPDETRATLAQIEEAGTTVLKVYLRSESLSHYLEQMAALVELHQ